jgi:hypothetical protein
MNRELEQRLQDGLPPFAGDTVCSAPLVAIPLVRHALREAIRLLRPTTAEELLFRLEDRGAAGAFSGLARPTRWNEIESWLQSDQRLFLARSGEPDVWVGIYPRSFSFYLRFYVDHEILPPGKPLEGRFDLTCGAIAAAQFEQALVRQELGETTRRPGFQHFASR